MMGDRVRIFEVGLRDGLQNEKKKVLTSDKLWLAQALVASGIRDLELGAFVRPDWVPQMSDTDQIFIALTRKAVLQKTMKAWALVLNQKGLERALAVRVKQIAVVTGATQSFTKANIGMSIEESLSTFKQLIQEARQAIGVTFKVRAYLSTAFGCPFEGKVSAVKSLKVLEKLISLNVDEISIGDTIGVATPRQIQELLKPALEMIGQKHIAIHLHDTRGTALANALKSLEMGVRTIDSSVGGLGGCPFAPGATGNLATEDLVYMLHGMGMKTGIDLKKLTQVSLDFFRKIKKPLVSHYSQAFAAQQIKLLKKK